MMRSTFFAEYIISACWHKMERRIGHWAAVGLMYNLCKLMGESVLSLLVVEDEVPVAKQSDVKLSMYLWNLGEKRSFGENSIVFWV
jgi:hypothetical protein